jgi:thymidylate synthase
MKNYIDLGNQILYRGHTEFTRVGPVLALHNQTLSFDLTYGFPLMTTKHVGQKSIIHELLWYLKGTTNIEYLKKNNVTVWDKFADKNGEIGKTYSYQFRNFNGVDQVKEVIGMLQNDDVTNRRAIINLYNIADLAEMSIPPCISLIQFNTYNIDGIKFLDMSVTQRSADFCLGVPYDIAEMALLAEIMAAYTGSIAKNMTFFYSNIHIYKAHISTLKEQLMNNPTALPTLVINRQAVAVTKPEDLTIDMFDFLEVPKRKKYQYELF